MSEEEGVLRQQRLFALNDGFIASHCKITVLVVLSSSTQRTRGFSCPMKVKLTWLSVFHDLISSEIKCFFSYVELIINKCP